MTATRPRDNPREATGVGEVVVTVSGYRVCVAHLSGSGWARPAGSDVTAAPALGGHAGERGEDEGDTEKGQPGTEHQSQHGEESAHPQDKGPDGGAGERVDHAGPFGDGGVIAVGRPVARAGRPAPEEELPPTESLVPEEVVQPREESQGVGADQHHHPAVLVAPEPVDGAHDAAED